MLGIILIPGNDAFLLELRMGSKTWYLTEVESSVGAGGKPSKGGNRMLWDGSDKISALKVSNKLWSHLYSLIYDRYQRFCYFS